MDNGSLLVRLPRLVLDYRIFLLHCLSIPAVRVRGANLPSAQEVCVNHFFTAIELQDNIIGLAKLGAICDTEILFVDDSFCSS